MAVSTTYGDNGVIWVYSGQVVDREIIDVNTVLYRHEEFLSLRWQIVDLLAVTDFAVASSTIREVARMDLEASARNPHVRVAIVATDALIHGLARMYELTGIDNPWVVEIFTEREAAQAWIDGETCEGQTDKAG